MFANRSRRYGRMSRRRRAKWPRLLALCAAALLAGSVGLLAFLPRTEPPPPLPPAPSPTATPAPSPTPLPAFLGLEVRPDAQVLPGRDLWKLRRAVYTNGRQATDYARESPIHFGDGADYTGLEGIVTFRGDNLRHNAAYGTAALKRCGFKLLWKKRTGAIDSGYAEWGGIGWNGQPVMVRWPDALRRAMNLREEYLDRQGLVEVIYGALDGKIYFMDAETGEPTRPPIRLGFPIKGSVSIDPRGYPLLYVGQGISKADGRTGKIGWRVYSLLDQRELFFLDGHDPLCLRDHGAFDGVCLVHGETDTVLEGGENGLFYSIRLNADYDAGAPAVSIHPEVSVYRYTSAASPELGIENSVAAYGQYAWFVDNSGLMTCLDLNAMAPAWLFYVGDDTDATIALEPEADGRLALYTVNEVDHQGKRGTCTVRRIDGMTGVVDWSFSVPCDSDGTNGGGGFASPAVGAHAYADYVYFNICRTQGGGALVCFEKQTGRVVWHHATGSASWSSPVLVYREDGTGALVLASNDRLRMFDPASGKKLGEIAIRGKVEGSPAVFGDLLVIGTRSRNIYGVRLT